MNIVRRSLFFLLSFLSTFFLLNGCVSPTTIREQSDSSTPVSSTSTPIVIADLELAKSEIERDLDPQVSPDDLALLTSGNNEFALDLYHVLQEEEGNLFFSPFSISTALAMIYAGARHNTEKQMADTLHFTLPQAQLHSAFNALTLELDRPVSIGTNGDNFQLKLANSLWGQKDFEYQAEYLDLIAMNYGTGLRLVDFIDEDQREIARGLINQWVSTQTEGKINELIQRGTLTNLTRLVLANAIYFNAYWETPFLNGTNNADFTLLDGNIISVPLMSRRAETRYTEGLGYQAVEITYQGDRAAMIVILPETGSFEAMEKSWDKDLITEIEAGLVLSDVKLFLPKFEYESSFSLAQPLADLGMPDAFDSGKADFTGITVHATPRLFIKHVLHQAFVSVDELGTEAAASTAVIAEVESMPIIMRIDRPFLYYIYDLNSETILFLGRVLDPTG